MQVEATIGGIARAVLFKGTIRHPRRVAIFLARRLTRSTLPQIGRRCGGITSTAVMHAIRMTERAMANDPVLVIRIEQLIDRLASAGEPLAQYGGSVIVG